MTQKTWTMVCSEMMRVGKTLSQLKSGERVHGIKEVGRLHEEIATDLGVEVHWSNGHTLDQFVVILEEALSHMPEGTFNAAFERVLLLRQGQQMAEAKRSDEEKGK